MHLTGVEFGCGRGGGYAVVSNERQIGGYQILDRVGKGGMATVFKARHRAQQGTVAIKVLFPMLAEDENFKTRFERELDVLLQLDHDNIVPVLDYGQYQDTAYIVMPYYRAGTLEDRLKNGSLTPKQGARLIGQVSSALEHAHQAGVVHRDVKPSNILLDEDGNALLTDFGLAHLVDASLSLTGSAVIGTPAYMSPEQCRGEEIDERSDQYSLGVILYQLCTGQLPYHADTPLAVVIQHATEPLPPPREMNANLPEEVEEVLLRALSKDPAARFPTVGAFNTGFQTALQEALRPAQGLAGHLRRAARHGRRNLRGVRQILQSRLDSSRLRFVVSVCVALMLFACPITAADLNSLIAGVAGARPSDPNPLREAMALPSDAPSGILTPQDASEEPPLVLSDNFIFGMEATVPGGGLPQTQVQYSPTTNPGGSATVETEGDSGKEPTLEKTQIPPATGTDEPSPTDPPTDTPGPEPTSYPTSVPTVTSTPSSTPTPTTLPTATASSTPKPTATQAGCSAGELITNDEFAGWELRNHGDLRIRVERIYIEWPWRNEAILSIRLGKHLTSDEVIWAEREFPPSATINSDWVDGANLDIWPGVPEVMAFEFADYAAWDGYRLKVTFHNNCVATAED